MFEIVRCIGKLAIFVVFMFCLKSYASALPNELLNMPINLISGEHISLAKYKNKKPVYIKFWASWCQPCLKEMPHFEHVRNKYGKSIEVIGINLGINDDLHAVKKAIDEFGLTMPMAIDKSGDLAQAFKMIGTPYHLLFDEKMNLIHQGHEANASLDNKLAVVSQDNPIDLLDIRLLSENESDSELAINDGKIHALFFTATWCDWYLKESRPDVAKNCSLAQENINVISAQYTDIVWHGVISRLWTGPEDLLAYKNKYKIEHEISIDKSNRLFHQYVIKDLPTLVVINNGKVVLRETNFNDKDKLERLLREKT